MAQAFETIVNFSPVRSSGEAGLDELTTLNHVQPHRLKALMVASRSRFRSSIETIGGWDFERIILAHGDPVFEGARPAFERAFSFLGVSGAPASLPPA